MSVKVIPYIDNKITTKIQSTVSTAEHTQLAASGMSQNKPVSSAEDSGSFESALRTQQAMAVDALLAVSNADGISPETIQRLLGFNPAPGAAVVTARMTSSRGTASTGSDPHTADTASDSPRIPATLGSSSNAANSSDALSCSADLDSCFAEASAKYNVDVNLLKAIARTESNFNPNATSKAGAMGIMQLMPSTAAGLGITDAYNAHDNIMGGAQVIAQNLSKYNGNLSLALAAYNAGSGNVDKYGGIPPFEETQNYVKKVLAYYNS